MILCISKKCITFFATSNLSVTIEFDSLKYEGNDLLVLLLDRISFTVSKYFVYVFALIKMCFKI